MTSKTGTRDVLPGSREKLCGDVRRFGILIGVNGYTGKIPKLQGCINDAHAMYDLMTDPKCGMFEPERVLLLEDPTRDEIYEAFARLSDQMNEQEENEFWFYYAGHGYLCTAVNNHSKVGYILPKDATINEKGKLHTNKAVSAHEIHSTLIGDMLPCKKVVMFIDCCHAGALGKNGMRGWADESERVGLENALRKAGDGYICFQATSVDDKAREREGADGQMHGEYTIHLLNGLRGGEPNHKIESDIANSDAIVTVAALNNYLSIRGQAHLDGSIDGTYPLSFSPTALRGRIKADGDQKKIQEWIKQFSVEESEVFNWLKNLSKGILKKRNCNEQLSSQETIVVTLLRRYALTDLASDQTAKDEFIRIAETLMELENQTEDPEEENKSKKKLQNEIERLKKEKEELEKKIQELENNPQPSPTTQFGRMRRTEELRMLAWVLCCINEHGNGILPWDNVAYWGKISDQEILEECCALVGKLIGDRGGEHVFPDWARSGWQNHVNGGKCSEIEHIVYKQIVADIQAENERKSTKKRSLK
ncbi:MAG: caspase family protein [Kiritimatiellae bacterium]|nr:caspase family protein [Kiritimatiellia bacterium]